MLDLNMYTELGVYIHDLDQRFRDQGHKRSKFANILPSLSMLIIESLTIMRLSDAVEIAFHSSNFFSTLLSAVAGLFYQIKV